MGSRHAVAATLIIFVLGALSFATAHSHPLPSLIAFLLLLGVFAHFGVRHHSRQRAAQRHIQEMASESVRHFGGSPDRYFREVGRRSA